MCYCEYANVLDKLSVSTVIYFFRSSRHTNQTLPYKSHWQLYLITRRTHISTFIFLKIPVLPGHMQEILERLCESLLRRRLSILSNAPKTRPASVRTKRRKLWCWEESRWVARERRVLLLWLCVLSGKPGCVQGRRNELLPPKRWYNIVTTNFFTALAHALIVFLSVAFVSRADGMNATRKLKCFSQHLRILVCGFARDLDLIDVRAVCCFGARKWHTL